jgi:steroid delta-isomerase-like uncharacterized protein
MSTLSVRQRLLKDFLDVVWSSGEIEQCRRFLADFYTIRHDPGDPWDGQTIDLASFQRRVRLSRAPFPDQAFSVQHWFENSDGVAISWLWSATHLDDLANFPASGQTVAMSGMTIYSFNAADRIDGHWQVTDRLGVFRQLQASLNRL